MGVVAVFDNSRNGMADAAQEAHRGGNVFIIERDSKLPGFMAGKITACADCGTINLYCFVDNRFCKTPQRDCAFGNKH